MTDADSRAADEDKVYYTGCIHDCGGLCVLKPHVRNGVIVRIETDDRPGQQYRACLRGRAYRQRVHHPDRLKYPMRRIGERGEGKFERISWDEALDTVAAELKRAKELHGPGSIIFSFGGANHGHVHGHRAIDDLLSYFGGFTRGWGAASFEGSLYAAMASYGTVQTGDSRDNLLYSKLIICWGWNPATTIWNTNTSLYLQQAKEAGALIVGVDPICTDTIATFAQEWVPIRPGTDSAALIAMAYVMIEENLHDQAFLDRYTVGFDQFRNYVRGMEDGVPKTPDWAASITGVPAETLTRLARMYATMKPAALIPGWGPGRGEMGEQFHRAAIVLAAMTGNVGVRGGGAAGFERWYFGRVRPGATRPPKNTVETGKPPRKYSLYRLFGGGNPSSGRIHFVKEFDAILKGTAGGYPSDIKVVYVVATNPLNSRMNLNKGIEAYRKVDFIVVHEQFMSTTARFADILLPVNTFMERDDIAEPWVGGPYYVYLPKVIDSLDESKSDLEIAAELAKRLDVPNYPQRTDKEMVQEYVSARPDIGLEGFQKMAKQGILEVEVDRPFISFQKQIEDPERNPFPTPSGKIEIYSEMLAEWNDERVPAIPKYIPPKESHLSALAAKYPLQLVSPHQKRRTHSTNEMVPWLREVEPQTVWINAADAAARGIKEGELVRVFNDRGTVLIPAKVTDRIVPGVVALYEGAYFLPDESGVDLGGNPNTLTDDEHSPGGAHPANTVLVEIARA